MLSRNEEQPITYAVTAAVPVHTIQRNARIMATAANIVLDLPSPQRRLAAFPFSVANTSSGWVSVMNSDFLGDNTGVAIEPYGRADFSIVKSSGSYYWSVVGGRAMTKTNTWTPTCTWTTADPADAVVVGEYWLVHGGVLFSVSISTTDGNAASALTITLPVIPAELEVKVPVNAWATVDGTVTNVLGYVDAEDNTEANRMIKFLNWQAWTNAKTCSLKVSGWYPLDNSMTAFTASETWATGAPASITEVALYKVIDSNAVLMLTDWRSADGTVTPPTGLTCVLPTTSQTPDRDGYVAATGVELVKTTTEYVNVLPTIDQANATAASRILTCNAFTTGIDNELIHVSLFGMYELAGWSSFDPDPTWGTADPGTITEKAYYYVDSLGICHFWVYLTSADGNGASSLVLKPPVAPKQNNTPLALASVQLQNSTYSSPCAFLDTLEATASDRTIQFDKWSTATNAQTVTVYVSGSYPVG